MKLTATSGSKQSDDSGLRNRSRFYQHRERIKNWYVLYTKPKAEKRVNLGLQEIGFETYLPLKKELRQRKDRKIWIETPLFKSYVFIKSSYKDRVRAFRINGIQNYV